MRNGNFKKRTAWTVGVCILFFLMVLCFAMSKQGRTKEMDYLESYCITADKRDSLERETDNILIAVASVDPYYISENRSRALDEGSLSGREAEDYEERAQSLTKFWMNAETVCPCTAEDIADVLYIKNAVAGRLMGDEEALESLPHYISQDRLEDLEIFLLSVDDEGIGFSVGYDKTVKIYMNSQTAVLSDNAALSEEGIGAIDEKNYLNFKLSKTELVHACMADILYALDRM